jgi:hypothetical protein
MNDPTFIYQPVKICDLCYTDLKDCLPATDEAGATSFEIGQDLVINQQKQELFEVIKDTIHMVEKPMRP